MKLLYNIYIDVLNDYHPPPAHCCNDLNLQQYNIIHINNKSPTLQGIMYICFSVYISDCKIIKCGPKI